MTEIIFFEKTGCVNNTKQKELLSLAGHKVIPIDILKHNWNENEILSFFKNKPIKDWFNMMAPSIKSGSITPDKYNQTEALSLLLSEHILIKRPLMIINNEYIVGFDKDFLDQKIGLSSPNLKSQKLMDSDIVTCPILQK